MKLKLILSCLIITFNNYSQENITKKENILIIANLTNDCFSSVGEIFPQSLLFQKEDFKFSQISAENVIAPNNDIACIIETPIRYETKFGKTNLISLTDYEVKFFYNEDGYLNKVLQKEGNPYNSKVIEKTFEINIGKYGELITKKNSYETNINGISKIIEYNEDGNVLYRYEIYYNSKGQIVKYDTFEQNEKQKKYTKSFDYDINDNLIKSSLVENYENEIKTIPRRNVIYSHTNKEITCKSMSNNFAEGINSFSDFSKIGGVSLNNFINNKKQKITISNKSTQEIKKEITKKWENSAIDYVYIFKTKPKLNNWEEKKIFNKLYNQTTEKELIYSVKRKYINKEELKKENNLTETREKINNFIDGIYSDKNIKNEENINKFIAFDIKLDKFCWWINAGTEYIFPENENYTKKIVSFYKNQSYKLAETYKTKIEDKTLTDEELSLNLKELTANFQTIIDQTLHKIEIRKRFADLEKKNMIIDKSYIIDPESQYKKIKKENLYSAYKILYDSAFLKSEITNEEFSELYEIQGKILQFLPLNTNKLEKTLKNEDDKIEIAKAISIFQVQ